MTIIYEPFDINISRGQNKKNKNQNKCFKERIFINDVQEEENLVTLEN